MEHLRRLSNDTVAVGLCLGLLASVSLSHEHDSLESRHTDLGLCHPRELDVVEQISQAPRSLHTTSG